MPSDFPTSLDALTNPGATTARNAVGVEHHGQHANANDAIEALEAKVGVDGSGVSTSLDYKVSLPGLQSTLSGEYVERNVTGRRVEIAAAAAGAATDAVIAAAYTAAGANGVVVWPGNRTYTTAATAVVTCATEAEAGAVLAPNHNGVGLQLGSASVEVVEQVLRLPRVIKASQTWVPSPISIGTDCGIRAVRVVACQIHVPHVSNFSYGVDSNPSTAVGDAVAYNTWHFGSLRENAINQRINPTGDGFVNQETYVGGRFVHNNGSGLVGTRQILSLSSGTYRPNCHTWVGTSLEGDGPDYLVEAYGDLNGFLGCRWEATTPKVRFRAVGGDNPGNWIKGGYDSERIDFSSSDAGVSYAVESPNGLSVVGETLEMGRAGESVPRFSIDQNGVIRMSSGGLSADVLLERTAAARAKLTGDCHVTGDVRAQSAGSAAGDPSVEFGAQGPGGQAGFRVGGTGDTNLYRSGANEWRTDDSFSVIGTLEPSGPLRHLGTTVGFNSATPVGKRTLGAAATDAASAVTLANNLRQALIDLGLGQT